MPMRSHHSLTRREIFQNLANRIIYSKFYMVLYIVMAILSLWSIFLSFHLGCASSSLFVILEVIINCTMIAEVALRLTALGRNYWRSTSNILDTFLVAFCFITLILVLEGCGHGPGHTAEEVLDTILLVLRNGVQAWRLYTMIRKNSLIANPRVGTIDFSNVRPVSLDIEGFGDGYHDDDYMAQESDDGL
ncbi:hypothetical protein BG006_001921 [Podila minutissima]|uniref:Ion transport domain-containing protein n=1 Tax=Podila minutissima TaxID=64525 RepID=A0A9P5SDK3_9FUNG|nr:hypothetical protein BG006_001921 [Podila minutissima]